MATTALTRSISSGSSITKFTLSFWFKRGVVSANYPRLFTSNGGSGDTYLRLNNDDTLEWSGNSGNASSAGYAITNRVFRDVGAYYNVVIKVDTTQVTNTNRLKIFVNGVQETSFSSITYPNQNVTDNIVNTGKVHRIGGNSGSSDSFYSGLISYVAFVDGTAYDATSFGETNAASGIWKINTAPSVTYGTNGFFLKMDTTSPGSDTSGNDNTFTAAGTPTLAQDNASNNLATNNPLCNIASRWTTTNGNNTIQHANGGAWTAMISSIGSSQGKYYMETKITAGASRVMFGVMSMDTNIMGYETNLDSICLYYNLSGGEFQQSGGTTSGNNYGTFADNDIAGIALDCTNNKISIYKNGSALVTDHTIPATVTGPIGFGFTSDSNSTIYQCNYGNGFFGVTAVASSNADAAGHGLFEYAVPTGYFTLNTKNLNTYGG